MLPLRTLRRITCTLLFTSHLPVTNYMALTSCKEALKWRLLVRNLCAPLKSRSLLLNKHLLSPVERRENKQTTGSLCDIFICGLPRLPELMFQSWVTNASLFRKKNIFLESIGNVQERTAQFVFLVKSFIVFTLSWLILFQAAATCMFACE